MSVLGMLLFISSEVMFFGALFGAYFTVRAQNDPWPPPSSPEIDLVIPIVLTILLVSSSFTQHAAVLGARTGDMSLVVRRVAATICLGGLFLVGQAIEYARLDAALDTNVFTTLFFTITGFHGLHVFAGLVAHGIVVARVRTGGVTAERHGVLEAATYYWHFVDAVWLFLFSTIYVLT